MKKESHNFSNLNLFLVILSYIGLYLFIDIKQGINTLVPAISFSLFALMLFVLHINKVSKVIAIASSTILFASFLSILFTTELANIYEKLRGLAYFSYSLICGIGFYYGIISAAEKLKPFLSFSIIFILFGAFFESILGFNELSNAFREIFFRGENYTADVRDTSFYSRVRPKFFQSEPSYLQNYVSLITIQLYLLSKGTRFNFVRSITAILLSGLLIGSPFFILGIIIIILIEASRNLVSIRNTRVLVNKNLSVYFILGFILAAPILASFFSERINRTLAGTEGSFTARVQAPIFMTAMVLEENILWGTGLSGEEENEELIFQATLILQDRSAGNDLSLNRNTFLQIFMSTGLIGGLLIIISIHFLILNNIKGRVIVGWIITLILLSHGLGQIHGARFWAYFFAILAAFSLMHKQEKNNNFREIDAT